MLRNLALAGVLAVSSAAVVGRAADREPSATPASAPATSTAQDAETRYYAVTLVTSFTPITDSKATKEFPKHTVYQATIKVFGLDIYFIRLGFFTTFADAVATKEKLASRYPGAWPTIVAEDERLAALKVGGRVPVKTRYAGPMEAPPPEPPRPRTVPTREIFYALNLDSSTDSQIAPRGPLPEPLRSYRLYRSPTTGTRPPLTLLNLGFFSSEEQAEHARKQLEEIYPNATVIEVSREEKENSVRTVVLPVRAPAIATPPAAPPIPPSTPRPDITPDTAAAPAASGLDAQAAELMSRGRDALTRGDNAAAIELFNRILMLPPNRYSQDAQEFAGLARERRGELDKARAEYELYLKLYPEGEGAGRVRQRLANLAAAPAAAKTLKEPRRAQAPITSIYGSVSQFYYRGSSHVETTPFDPVTANPLDTTTLTAVDQSALITNVDINGRYRSEDWDNRVVFRDTHTLNFLDNDDNDNRLTAAYFDVKNRRYDYSARIGRQSGSAGGVLGRFDGGLFGYGFSPKWRVNVVAGVPADFKIDTDRRFYGLSLDAGVFADHWSGAAYLIQQEADGIVDRQAIGTEVRYFDPRRSFFSVVDYDVSYGALNTFLFQGTWQTGSATTYNLLADHRRTPTLQTTNALIGETTSSISTLLQSLSEDQVRALATARTATADLYMIGATHSFNSTWQLGGDVRLSSISGTDATTTLGGTPLPATPGTGNVYIYTAQAIGTGLLTKREVSVLSLSYIDGNTYTGQSVSLTNRSILRDKWTIDASLRYYRQKDDTDSELSRLTPTLRLGYRWKDKVSLEIEGGIEDTSTLSATQQDDSKRTFWSLGYRWDF